MTTPPIPPGDNSPGDNSPSVQPTTEAIYYRASSLGSCTRRLLASRLRYDAQSPPPQLQAAFDQGHALEPAILYKLAKEEGWILDSPQKELELHLGWNDYEQSLIVRGHVDAMGIPPFATKRIPVDAKAFASSTMARFLAEGIEAFPHYSYQQSAYALAAGCDSFCLALYNKGTEQLVVKVYDTLPISYEEIQEKVFQVEALVAGGDPTDAPCSNDWGCPYSYLHDTKQTDSIPDPAIPLLENYLTAKHKVDTYKKVMDVLKGQITELIEYTDDLRTFSSPIATITVKDNPKRLNTQMVKELLTEAGLDVDDYYTPGEGVQLVIKEK